MGLPYDFPWWPADALPAIYDPNVVNEAISRLIQQYKKPLLMALVGACATPAQDVEDAFFGILVQRWINSAAGAQLDVLGEIVGQARQGLPDDQYQLFIMARILVNKSSGGPEEIYSIFKLLIPAGMTMVIKYFPPAAFTLTFGGVALDNVTAGIFASLFNDTIVAGVGGQIIWSINPPSGTFTLDGSAGQALDNGALAEAAT